MNSKLQSIFINEIVLHRDPLIQKTRSISKEGQVDDSDGLYTKPILCRK